MFPVFILAEVGPKNLFRMKADRLMYRFAGLLRLLVWMFYPFTWLLDRLFSFLTHGMNEEPGRELHRLSPDGLKEYFSVGAREGLITSHQSMMMDNTTSMHSVRVRTLMAPFRNIPRLPAGATVADFRRLAARRNTSFALLMSRHTVVGMISMFSIVSRRLGDEEILDSYADEVLKLPENRNLKSAFYRLRRNPRHSAVVIDARRHPVGFLQLEDIARYIAGK
jgi:CBS domain containing-hemolysin-like protein